MLDFLPDRFEPPGPPHYPNANGSTVDPTTDPRSLYMIPRCWLEIKPIVRRLTQLKLEYAEELELRKVYISTNGGPEWVDSLKKALLDSGWQSVSSTYDLELTWEESGVDSAVGASGSRVVLLVISEQIPHRYGACRARKGVRWKWLFNIHVYCVRIFSA